MYRTTNCQCGLSYLPISDALHVVSERTCCSPQAAIISWPESADVRQPAA